MALQGTLDTFALPDVLRLLAATKKTGRLRITGGRGTGAVWIDGGSVTGLDASHAAHVTEPVDTLFELLRFTEGSFTFDADVLHEAPTPVGDVEQLLDGAETLLAEWREIESVVPSMDAWVTLRRTLPEATVSIAQAQWNTIVAVGSGATVRRMSDDLCLAELPVSRAVRELLELGVVEVSASAPAGAEESRAVPAPAASDRPSSIFVPDPLLDPTDASSHEPEPPAAESAELPAEPQSPAEDAPLPVARPIRARRAKGPVRAEAPAEPEHFVPLDLPGHGPAASYDAAPSPADETPAEDPAGGGATSVDDLAAAFPGLANRLADPTPDDEEVARQLAQLSPRAAEAVRAAAEATTVEERDAALDAVDDGAEQPINRGMLLKFLSSVRS